MGFVKKGVIIGIVVIIAIAGLYGSQFVKTPDSFQGTNQISEFENTESKDASIQEKTSTQSSTQPTSISVKSISSKTCSGDARCLSGTVSKVIDGDTIVVGDQSVRLALSSTPELNESMGMVAKQYVQQICPVGSKVIVDEDDGQTQESYGRIVGVVYCNGVNLNAVILEQGFGNFSFIHCDKSEFSSQSWAQKGCNPTHQKILESSYQSSSYQGTSSNCDPNYSGACIPLDSPDLDCKDVPSGVKVVGDDKHRLDRDGDGIACE